jgi:hypothetical protein
MVWRDFNFRILLFSILLSVLLVIFPSRGMGILFFRFPEKTVSEEEFLLISLNTFIFMDDTINTDICYIGLLVQICK